MRHILLMSLVLWCFVACNTSTEQTQSNNQSTKAKAPAATKAKNETAATKKANNTTTKTSGKAKLTDKIWKIDTKKSRLKWVGSKPTGKHDGTVNLKTGVLTVKNNQILGGKLILDMKSIAVTDIKDAEKKADLVGHLSNEDFFNIEKYPTASFNITKVEPIPNATDGMNYQMTGDLQIKETAKPVSFKFDVTERGGKLLARSENFTINRTEWGINYKSKSIFKNLADRFINDEIEFTVLIMAN